MRVECIRDTEPALKCWVETKICPGFSDLYDLAKARLLICSYMAQARQWSHAIGPGAKRGLNKAVQKAAKPTENGINVEYQPDSLAFNEVWLTM